MNVDANTIITAVIGGGILSLSGFILYTLHDMSKNQAADRAATFEREKAQDAKISENRSRLIEVEKKVGALEVDMGALKAKRA